MAVLTFSIRAQTPDAQGHILDFNKDINLSALTSKNAEACSR
jgi:hypothetical protein